MKKNKINYSNPLYAYQREKSGSDTINKYHYQYHWALFEALVRTAKRKEYVVIIELHEDVVIGDSLDANCVKFEFFQVKEANKTYSIQSIISSSKDNSQSILSKLLSSVKKHELKYRIKSIGLVASNGFSFKSKEGTDLKILKVLDLKEDDKKKIENAIKREIPEGLDNCIELQFIHSDLPSKSDELAVKGKISEVIATLFPNSKYNVEDIYRMLIDELFRKGEDNFDYKEWNDLLDNKALTSNKVINAIEISTNTTNDDIAKEFETICSELNFQYRKKQIIKKGFLRHGGLRQNRDASTIAFLNDIQTNLHKLDRNFELSTRDVIEFIKNNLSENSKNYYPNEEGLEASIIYEIICHNNQ